MAKRKTASPVQPRMTVEDRKWRARDDLRTLQSAQEISHDKSRLSAAQREAQAQIAALAKVRGTKK